MTRDDAPTVSVGVPVYNGEAFLERALASLVAQDFESLEIIVSDNGSDDGTREIASSFARADERVSYHRSDENRGAAWNFNRTFLLSRGRFFKWAASDDECRPSLIRRCVEELEGAGEAVVLCYPRTELIDAGSRVVGDFHDGLDLPEPLPHQRLRRLLRSQTEYHPVFGVIRSDVLRRTRLIDRFVASDVVLLAELALAGRFAEIPERLFARRFHPGTSVLANPDYKERAAWFDPARSARVPMPRTRLTVELLRSVARSSVDRVEKLRSAAVVVQDWAVPGWRTIGGECRQALAVTLARRRDAGVGGVGIGVADPGR